MWGIDAPESGQEYGAESSRLLASKALGKLVRVQVRSTDIYGRLIGEVYSGNEYINVSLLESGCAWYYERYAPRDIQLSEAQRKAQKCKNGIWATDSPLAPWLYRKINRTRLSNYAISPLIAAAASGHTEIVEYLIRAGADANGLAGKLALFAAIREGHEEVVSVLLASGVDVYTKNDAYSQKCVSAIQSTGEFKGKCIRVIDGDSIDVCIDTGEIRRVHLHGIDAPELSQKHGLAAQGFLLQNVRDEQLVVSPVGKDSNGGIIANVYKEDEHVNRKMVASGWAWSEEDPHVEKSVLASESKKARMAKKGIWNDEDQPVISPWKYRQSEKIVSDTGKIAISLAASSGKFKIAKQLLAHGVSVDDEVGSVALKYAQDAKSAELSRLLVEKGAQVIPVMSSINRGARELACSEICKSAEYDYNRSFSLFKNNFYELDNYEQTGDVDIEEQRITSARNQFAREGRSDAHDWVDAEEANLIKAAAEGDLETVKALVESGVDANATYSRSRIQAKQLTEAYSKGNESTKVQPASRHHVSNNAVPTGNSAIMDIGRDKTIPKLKSLLNFYPLVDSESKSKLLDFSSVSLKQSRSTSSSSYYENESGKGLPISYTDTMETNGESYIESYSSKKSRYSGHRPSSSSGFGRNNYGKVIGKYIVIGIAGLFLAYIICVSVDWYKIAIRNRSLFLTKLLYSLGFKIEGREAVKHPLYYAALYGDASITEFLISKGSKMGSGFYGPLETALKKKHYEVAKILLTHGADACASLWEAIEQGNQECMYFLCFSAPEILSNYDFSKNSMLKAIQTNNYNSVACLLKHGAFVDASFLSQAIKKNCGRLIIKEIINNGVKPTIYNLKSSIVYGSMDSFMEILDYGIDINSPISIPPLCDAVRYGCFPMVKELLDRGSDINRSDVYGNTPFLIAVETGNYPMAKELIDRGACVNISDKYGRPPILIAAEIGNRELLRLLIERGSNVNSADSKGKTCLEYAIMLGMPDICLLLIEYGADVLARRHGATTLLYKAKKKGLDEVVKKIREKGGCMYAYQQDAYPVN